jgi:hypothetical protein
MRPRTTVITRAMPCNAWVHATPGESLDSTLGLSSVSLINQAQGGIP